MQQNDRREGDKIKNRARIENLDISLLLLLPSQKYLGREGNEWKMAGRFFFPARVDLNRKECTRVR